MIEENIQVNKVNAIKKMKNELKMISKTNNINNKYKFLKILLIIL